MERNVGLLLIAMGALVAVVGLLVWAGALSWVGRLPGDLRFEGERTRVHLPIVSMLLISLVLTVIVNVAIRWLR